MHIIDSASSLQEHCRGHARDGRSIAFVPTMGFLHDGHLSLIEEGRRRAEILVVSIFVNPLQFGEGEDLDSYPRALERDGELCRQAGVDVLFVPNSVELYPGGFQTKVSVAGLAAGLCGAARPGHFDGVCTVVLKLLNLVHPDLAIFGSKDFQQLQVIRAMVRDLHLDLEVVGMPIVREEDGLAMSSRNAYLSPPERAQSLALVEALRLAEAMVEVGERNTESLREAVISHIQTRELAAIDYVELVDAATLEPSPVVFSAPVLLALAVRFGSTRLIDNRVLSPR